MWRTDHPAATGVQQKEFDKKVTKKVIVSEKVTKGDKHE